MNVLPTGPFHLGQDLEVYFRHLDKFNFDVAYIAYYAYGWAKTTGEYKEAYLAFAEEAHRRGLKACIQIQTVLALEEDIPLTEAQYFSNEEAVHLGPGVFMASFASQRWRAFLKKLGRVFVSYGYDWIVHEEPCWPVDIPGSSDPLYRRFRERYPDIRYPFNAEGTSLTAEQFRNNLSMLDRRLMRKMREKHQLLMHSREYELVQLFKMDMLVEFFQELAGDAKEAGAQKFGVMPWIFTPTSENTPAVTMNACCHLGRIALIDELDFLVVRMQPDNIYYHDDPFNGLIDELGEAEPRLYYLETMAHQLSKQVVTVNNPTNERNFIVSRSGEHSGPLPLDFFKRCTLAIMAANPNGMTRHWYDENHFEKPHEPDGLYEEHTYIHNLFQSEHLPWLTRLGSPVADLGFVFSFEASSRAQPWGREETWRAYYRFASEMMYRRHIPMKTLYTGTLRKNLKVHPELKVIVLSDCHPVSGDDEAALKEWFEEKKGRSIVAFGSYAFWHRSAFNRGERSIPWANDRDVPSVMTENQWGNRAYWLEADLGEPSEGLFVEAVIEALNASGRSIEINSPSPDVLWSANRWGYLSLSNTGPGSTSIQMKTPADTGLFNVIASSPEVRDPNSIVLSPYEFALWRIVDHACPWLDIQGQLSIMEVDSNLKENSVTFVLETTRKPIEVLVASVPTGIYLNGGSLQPKVTVVKEHVYKLRIAVTPEPAVQHIRVEWRETEGQYVDS
jgi:hypothetical protein